MARLRFGLRITALVWILATIGLVAGIITNGLIGWTLSEVSSERLVLLEQENRVLLTAQQLRQAVQQTQQALSEMLRPGQPSLETRHALDDYDRLAAELGQSLLVSTSGPLRQQLDRTSSRLHQLWEQSVAWRDSYRPIEAEEQHKTTLNEVRGILQRLRVGIETFEGQHNLRQAEQLRAWRRASGDRRRQLAAEILDQLFRPWNRVLNEIKTELVDLSRLVEILAGESQLDQLADLRDNQLKPSLERLEYQLGILGREQSLEAVGSPLSLVESLKEKLFGRGYVIVPEYQTIRPGRGGLYRIALQRLKLQGQREALQQELFSTYQGFEQIYPQLFNLAGERGKELSGQSERTLARALSNLQLLSILTLAGFLGLGALISRAARHQVDQLNALRRQNELLLNSAGEGILGLDHDGQIIFANPAGARQLHRDQQGLIGCNYRDVLVDAGEDGLSVGEVIERTLQQGDYHRSDDRFFRRSGDEHFPVVFSVAAMHDEREEIEGAVLVFQDITRRKDAEQRLREYYEKIAEQEEELKLLNQELEGKVAERTLALEKKNRELLETQDELARSERLAAIGSLAAGVAHEINNPAAIIRGNVEILKMTLSPDTEGHEEVDEVLRQVERISLITQNLLVFARKQSLEYQLLDINNLLAEILDQIGHHVPLDQVEVQFDPAMNLPTCQGDGERLRQVFTNLIVNGLQAMEGEGTLRVESRLVDGEIRVSVADSGPGIPEEVQGRIFDPFFTTKSTGTGLGLSVSYGIVQAHGGSIELFSAPKIGSIFTVRLKAEGTGSAGACPP